MKQVSFFEITVTMILLFFIMIFCEVSLRLGSDFLFILFYFPLLVYLLFLLKKHHISLSFFLPEKKRGNRSKDLGLYTLVFLSFILFITGLHVVGFHFLAGLDNEQALLYFGEIVDTQPTTVWLFLGGMFLAPLVEELLFRGILTNKLARNMNVKTALLISVLVFSIAHLRLDPTLILWGFFFNIVYIKSQSLLYPIVFHFMYNSISEGLRIFFRQPKSFRIVQGMRTLPDSYVWLIYLVTFGALIYLLVVLFIWVFKKKYALSPRGRIVMAEQVSE